MPASAPPPSCSLVFPLSSRWQGDGTAAVFRDQPEVFTLSVHAASNFPARKQASDLDIGLADGTADEEYLGWVAGRPWLQQGARECESGRPGGLQQGARE